MRVLIVEDDCSLADVLRRGFSEHGIDVVHTAELAEARSLVMQPEWNVIVLDVMLPTGSGFDLCREMRQAGLLTPVLMLTARDALEDRVTGLELGADDYVTKPFAFRELVARVRGLARRAASRTAAEMRVADLTINLVGRRASRAGRVLDLTHKEFQLLELLASRVGVVVTRQAIAMHLWGSEGDSASGVLDVLLHRLRAKVDRDFGRPLLATVRGRGYRLQG
ncbi:MAG: response regulator transcription factor [Gemmatimonadaceae bacterium]|nr:response regulator transcription factor [Gemmatimonadaceae bacterium]